MVDSNQAQAILSQYQAGERHFPNLALRHIDLHGFTLAGADFSGSDFSEANLRGSDLQGCKLQGCYFNNADLSGANLARADLGQASLLKTFLLKVNLHGAHLDQALCAGALLTRANLEEACLHGALLTGADLTGAKLTNAKYNQQTQFDAGFKPENFGLIKVAGDSAPSPQTEAQTPLKEEQSGQASLPTSLTVEDLLLTFEYLGSLGNHYLGSTMASRYLQSTRPKEEWFAQFEVDKKAVKLNYQGPKQEQLTPTQIELAQQWAQQYVKSCAVIFKTFSTMIETDRCVFSISG
ncbi:pentapeptide repeat-containing protein [Synechocystis sp. LEGE 06083]|uniref:pentapeptide repeat-containing protein n=1 Tax=Synechocystis sp. LEGE 06083 TaxID=915336 RepID=UPI001882949A|nr:pentapeptide repeat-containing protein [Synechocystis sp. LEGE 06083]MBE9195791.1 pentapeptide repeat-containing protein [Synechocystis sp. LEGE 06083]